MGVLLWGCGIQDGVCNIHTAAVSYAVVSRALGKDMQQHLLAHVSYHAKLRQQYPWVVLL